MEVKKLTLKSPLFPAQLAAIHNPPQLLYYVGDIQPLLGQPRLAIVGSRKVSAYGKSVTHKLALQAAEQGIVIVSGLALGVDGLAHEAALQAGGKTIAVLPSGLDKVYPSSHQQLAERIVQQGGALISEYSADAIAFKTNFVERNRLVSGISDAVLVTEAAAKSGSLHTANFAKKQGRTLMAVPGNITSELSYGTNNLIKSGANPVTEIRDILSAMGLKRRKSDDTILQGATETEKTILSLIASGINDATILLHESQLSPAVFNQTLTMLEISGKVRSLGNGKWGKR